jgi:aquaporin Z
MRKATVEFIGTFFLVATVGCTGIGAGHGVIPPLAIGAILMVMVYAGGHVSGANYNPAVSLGIFLRGRLPASDLATYWGAQLLAGVAAAALIVYNRGTAPTVLEPNISRAFFAEMGFTFALVYVVLNTATARATAGNSYFGLAIGFTVLAGAFAVGNVSGGAFNPAVAVGAMMMGMLPWQLLWLYLAADLLGGAAAAMAFKWINPDDR